MSKTVYKCKGACGRKTRPDRSTADGDARVTEIMSGYCSKCKPSQR